MPRRRLVVVVLGIAVLAAFLFRGPLLRGSLALVLDTLTGYRFAFDDVDLGSDRIALTGVRVARGADPLLDAGRITVDYRLSDVFGGPRRYGLYGVTIERPHVTIVRYADGSFNFIAPAAAAPSSSAPAGRSVPLIVDVRVAGGSLTVLDANRRIANARRLDAGDIALAAHVDTGARTSYHLSADAFGDRAQTMTADGRVDASGYAVHRVRADDIAIVPWVNYFINSPGAQLLAGRARALDVRFYRFDDTYHIAGSAQAVAASMRVPGVVPSAVGMTGPINFFDTGLATTSMRAELGPLAVRLAGSLYDWRSPKFELGLVAANAPLEQLRTLFHFSAKVPISGPARVATLLEGPVPSLVVASVVGSPAATYARFPMEQLRGRAIYYNQTVELANVRANYGGLDVGAGGTIVIGTKAATSDLVATVDGPAARVPYAAQVAPGARLHAVTQFGGDQLKLDARGVATGEGGGTRVSAVFHIDPQGEGTFGPLRAERDDGTSIAGTYYLDRENDTGGFWLDAQRYRFTSLAPHAPRLPGLELAPPDFSGTLDGSVAAYGHPSDFRLAGRVRARDFTAGKVTIADMTGDVTGHLGDLHVGNVRASGAWGSFTGRGGYAGQQLALEGRYLGSFEALRGFTGDLGAKGPIAGPVAMLIGAKRVIVQARGERSAGSRVRNVPVDAFDGTLAYDGRDLRVYSANASVAGGRFAAAGTLAGASSRNPSGTIGVSVAGADAARLHAIVPLQGGGAVATIGRFGYAAGATRYDGGLALDGAHVAGVPVSAGGNLVLAGTRLEFAGTSARAGSAIATLAGTVTSLGTLAPQYDVAVGLSPTSLGSLAAAMGANPRYVNGTVEGDVRVGGTPSTLALRGRVALPEGSVDGQSFSAASADLDVSRTAIGARAGSVTVGTTTVAFGAFFQGSDGAVRIDADRANLADFNDLFDTGDTLGGRGHVRGSFVRPRGGHVRTQADLAIAKLQYKSFGLGDAKLHWNSTGSNVVGDVSFGGTSGRLEAAGTVVLPAKAPVEKILERSSFSGNAQLRGLDLGVWLPALGYQLPVTGRVDADASVTGPLRNPDVRTSLSLVDGTFGKFPVDKFAVTATSTLSRTTLQKFEIDLPSIVVTGSGNFGLRPADKVALRLHARSPDIGLLSARALGAAVAAGGTLEADLTVDGTRASPRIAGGFDLEAANVRGVKIPRALGQLSLHGRDLVLDDAEVGLGAGTLYLAGSLPLELAPFAFGPANAPIEMDFTAKGVDVADFAPLFPSGSQLSGGIAGHVKVAGTVGAPRLDGALALVKGALVTPFETFPLTDVGGELAFNGTSIALRAVHASSGGGTIDASGRAMLADLVHPGQHATYAFDARAQHIKLSLPAYGAGTVDGSMKLAHVPGSAASLSGSMTLDDATIPFAALLIASGAAEGIGATPDTGAAGPPVDDQLALNLDLVADKNVRVRSANVDIGGTGTLHVGGLRSAPRLSGGFDSTGGTLAYFNTVFRVTDGRVTFEPDLGLIPLLDAHAETHVINPDPNAIRNIAGTADITLDIHGPVTGLSIGLSSDPSYDREQILGLLLNAPALGATTLFGDLPGQATLYGSTAVNRDPIARNAATATVAQEAFGVANAQFTRTLLAPIETSFAQAVGLSAFNVNVDITGNVGFQARKILGKEVNAIYGTTFGYPYRQTVGFELKPNASTAAQVTVFQTFGATPGLTSLNPAEFTSINGNTSRVGAGQPSNGTIGFSVSLQHFFK